LNKEYHAAGSSGSADAAPRMTKNKQCAVPRMTKKEILRWHSGWHFYPLSYSHLLQISSRF